MENQLYIGMMSGTSMDGVDAVLVRMEGAQWQAAEAHTFLPYPADLKERLLALQTVGFNELHTSRMLALELSEIYAAAVKQLLSENGLQAAQITAIGCHGQTVRHAPKYGYTVQLADLALLAERCGIAVVGDFRSGDLAAGGQGAPLVPAFHRALFAAADAVRVVLNIGGIANISVLPVHEPTFGYDTGPGNMLLDAWVKHIWQLDFDDGGRLAASGTVLPELLHDMLSHHYFRQPYPKSTGRELFDLSFIVNRLRGGESPQDVLRTLVELTASTIMQEIARTAGQAQQIFVCGGGIRNPVLMASLTAQAAEAGMSVHSTDELNLNPQWVEAAAFAWLAACRVNRVRVDLCRVTGAAHSYLPGCVYLP